MPLLNHFVSGCMVPNLVKCGGGWSESDASYPSVCEWKTHQEGKRNSNNEVIRAWSNHVAEDIIGYILSLT